MPVKKSKPKSPEDQKIWGFFTDEGEAYNGLTYKQACDQAVEYKKKWPHETVTIYRSIAVVENQPVIKGV